jgi:hypothetical protein
VGSASAPGAARVARALLWALACGAALGCAGDLVVAAPRHGSNRPDSVLRGVGPYTVGVLPVPGAVANGPLGRREAGPATGEVPIALTEDPSLVLTRLVAGELRNAGHRVVDAGGDVAIEVRVVDFALNAPRRSPGWDVQVSIRMALRVARQPGDEGATEFVYTAERSKETWVAPGVRTTEEVLAEALSDLGRLVAQRGELAAALARYAGS